MVLVRHLSIQRACTRNCFHKKISVPLTRFHSVVYLVNKNAQYVQKGNKDIVIEDKNTIKMYTTIVLTIVLTGWSFQLALAVEETELKTVNTYNFQKSVHCSLCTRIEQQLMSLASKEMCLQGFEHHTKYQWGHPKIT